jgi:hypothetical protein
MKHVAPTFPIIPLTEGKTRTTTEDLYFDINGVYLWIKPFQIPGLLKIVLLGNNHINLKYKAMPLMFLYIHASSKL